MIKTIEECRDGAQRGLRWLRFEDDERSYCLWKDVYPDHLQAGDTVRIAARKVTDRDFYKITKLERANREEPTSEDQKPVAVGTFSKTESGMMLGVALKGACDLPKNADLKVILANAKVLYAWLKEQRLQEMADEEPPFLDGST